MPRAEDYLLTCAGPIMLPTRSTARSRMRPGGQSRSQHTMPETRGMCDSSAAISTFVLSTITSAIKPTNAALPFYLARSRMHTSKRDLDRRCATANHPFDCGAAAIPLGRARRVGTKAIWSGDCGLQRTIRSFRSRICVTCHAGGRSCLAGENYHEMPNRTFAKRQLAGNLFVKAVTTRPDRRSVPNSRTTPLPNSDGLVAPHRLVADRV